MSAWIVEKAHIDVLVQALIVEGIIKMEQADETGRMLWHENHLSIQARYGDDPQSDEVDAYVFEGIEAPLADLVVLHAAGCYDYQTCEHRGWETSEAHTLVGDGGLLGTKVGIRLGLPTYPSSSEYDYRPALAEWERKTGRKAPWGISNIEQAIEGGP